VKAVLNEPPVTLVLDLRIIAGGKPQVVELDVISWADIGDQITGTILRAIPLDHVVRAAIAHAELPIVAERGDVEPDAYRFFPSAPEVPRVIDRAAQAAEIYAQAKQQNSKAPTEAAALEMGVSRSTAARLIREARSRGLLPGVDKE
jgi:predicted DNA-binding protein (UPF0251 family)